MNLRSFTEPTQSPGGTAKGGAGEISRYWFAYFSKPIIFLILTLALVGMYEAFTIPIAVFPETNFPRIVIGIDNGVMPIDQMTVTVTRPVEEAVNSVLGLQLVQSITSRGSAEIDLYFDWNVDMFQTLERVNSAMARARSALPSTAEIRVDRLTFASFPIMGYSLTSHAVPQTQLWELATYNLKPRLNRLQGVSSVVVQGGQEPEFHIIPDPTKLLAAGVTVTDLLESPVMKSIFPELYKHLKLVSSTPIRNMATLAGNFVNASPIGDMTVWFLALNAEITLNTGRDLLLRQLYLGYKKLAKEPDEYITAIRFKKPLSDFRFNFEKVCKRTYLDIASVNTAVSFRVEPVPGQSWMPPAIERRAVPRSDSSIDHFITEAHVAAGGVAPVPLYLKETSSFLIGRFANDETIEKAIEIIQAEISPISDVRGSEAYKRLLLSQLFRAHFVELFGL